MSALSDLLNQAAQKCDPANDAALAARLGVSRSAISLWRKGEGIREKHLAALISIAHADPRMAVTVLQEQATTASERSVWGSLAKQLGAAAMLAIAALLPVGNARAAAVNLNGSASYALCEVVRRWYRACKSSTYPLPA